MENGDYKEILQSINTLSGEMRELKGYLEANAEHTNRVIENHTKRIDKRETEIDDVKDEVNDIKQQISGFRGQMIMLKILGGIIGLLLAGLEIYRIYNPPV